MGTHTGESAECWNHHYKKQELTWYGPRYNHVSCRGREFRLKFLASIEPIDSVEPRFQASHLQGPGFQKTVVLSLEVSL